MSVPAGWNSETKLAVLADVPGNKRFHRNLVHWRHRRVLPSRCDGLRIPFVRPLGVGKTGNECFYPPAFVPIIRRINELRTQTRDMNEWRWQLWVDGYPADIVEYCREGLLPLLKAFSSRTTRDIEYEITRQSSYLHYWRQFYRRTERRLLGTLLWYAWMKWFVRIAAGSQIAQSVHDPVSPPSEAFAKLMNLPAATVTACLWSGIEDLSISRLLETIENADANELKRARIDCKALGRLEIRGMPSRIRHGVRACFVPAMIMLRRSPDHQDDIAAKLAMAGLVIS